MLIAHFITMAGRKHTAGHHRRRDDVTRGRQWIAATADSHENG